MDFHMKIFIESIDRFMCYNEHITLKYLFDLIKYTIYSALITSFAKYLIATKESKSAYLILSIGIILFLLVVMNVLISCVQISSKINKESLENNFTIIVYSKLKIISLMIFCVFLVFILGDIYISVFFIDVGKITT
jgi:hypothetical protein